jgi:imidazolonepropionase-like amidohydrolase
MAQFDLVIRNGLVIDGSGHARRDHGGVAVRDGVIVAVGEVDGRPTRTIDAGRRGHRARASSTSTRTTTVRRRGTSTSRRRRGTASPPS